ncbi:WD40-repeat-containing domain protein [Abortiporus biennis]|nr:WD40-repeat-containing domain protein [Abortiporus biennis]
MSSMKEANTMSFKYTMGLPTKPLTSTDARAQKKQYLSGSLNHVLDRVNVLGDNDTGHTGCVNALSWAKNGEILLSGGDDTTVRVWRMDMSNTDVEYPFVCDAVLNTGHRGNIFNAQMLPYSTRIVTVAGDRQIRICDVGDFEVQPGIGRETIYSARQAGVRVLRCHSRAVKRITTEDSPDLFLTVSEDGTVRQHDLRVAHSCSTGPCATPLVKFSHSLSTLALSPLAPYQFVVAGESPYGYLFDRRQLGRHLEEEWGVPPDSHSLTTCVRRFGRPNSGSNRDLRYEHITGARMATSNSHEVLLSYSSDAVYLYSTHDSCQTTIPSQTVLPSNSAGTKSPSTSTHGVDRVDGNGEFAVGEADIERILEEIEVRTSEEDEADPDGEDEDDDMEPEDEDEGNGNDDLYSSVPIIPPRARYVGACNVETVKDVNFLGPEDEFIVSGSDDGHFFVWDKETKTVHDILEADGHVVNVIESHPYLPVVAVSGIDTTVKLFAPAHGESAFSRLGNAEAIMDRNANVSARGIDLSALMIYARIARRVGLDEEQCAHQ